MRRVPGSEHRGRIDRGPRSVQPGPRNPIDEDRRRRDEPAAQLPRTRASFVRTRGSCVRTDAARSGRKKRDTVNIVRVLTARFRQVTAHSRGRARRDVHIVRGPKTINDPRAQIVSHRRFPFAAGRFLFLSRRHSTRATTTPAATAVHVRVSYFYVSAKGWSTG